MKDDYKEREYKNVIVGKIISRIKELDSEIRITKYENYIALNKIVGEDNFFSTAKNIDEILRLEYIFGLDMVSEDIVKSLNEDIKECFEGE